MQNLQLPCSLLILALSGCTATVDIHETTDATTKSESGEAGGSSSPMDVTGEPSTTDPPDKTTGTGEPAETGDNDTTGASTTSGPGETTGTNDTGDTTTAGDTTTGGGTMTGGDTTTAGDTTTGDTTAGDTTTGGDAGLADWSRYREVLIDNGLVDELKDFQVFVDIKYDTDMSPDYADLRFTDETGTVLLPHWLEQYTAPVGAQVWVRVPVVAGDDITTIRMYYGNPAAVDASNGTDTFLFFDDFLGASLDPAKWKATAPTTVDFGELKVTNGAVYSTKPISAYPDTLFEARMQSLNEQNTNSSCLSANAGQGAANVPYLMRCHGSLIAWDGKKYLIQQNTQDPGEMMVIMGMGMDPEDIYFYMGRGLVPTIVAGTLPISYYAILGHPWGNGAGMQNTRDIKVDWTLVRRFTPQPPTTFVGGEKQP